jgi:hypothetical protein
MKRRGFFARSFAYPTRSIRYTSASDYREREMRLYNVPSGSRIRVLDEIWTPPDAPEIHQGEELFFDHLDGLFSVCENQAGETVRLGLVADVDPIERQAS